MNGGLDPAPALRPQSRGQQRRSSEPGERDAEVSVPTAPSPSPTGRAGTETGEREGRSAPRGPGRTLRRPGKRRGVCRVGERVPGRPPSPRVTEDAAAPRGRRGVWSDTNRAPGPFPNQLVIRGIGLP